MEVQGVLARGDRRLAGVLLDLPTLSLSAFWQTMAAHGLDRAEFLGARPLDALPPWYIVESGVSDNFFHYEWRLAERSQTGPHCPPDSAGCLTCGSCDPAWAFRATGGVPQKPARATAPSRLLPIPLLA
jgi:hypothetical protein